MVRDPFGASATQENSDQCLRRACETVLPAERDERYYCPPAVRSGAQTSVALRSVTDVLALRANSLNPPRRSPDGMRQARANDANAGLGGLKPQYWRRFRRGAANSPGQRSRVAAARPLFSSIELRKRMDMGHLLAFRAG